MKYNKHILLFLFLLYLPIIYSTPNIDILIPINNSNITDNTPQIKFNVTNSTGSNLTCYIFSNSTESTILNNTYSDGDMFNVTVITQTLPTKATHFNAPCIQDMGSYSMVFLSGGMVVPNYWLTTMNVFNTSSETIMFTMNTPDNMPGGSGVCQIFNNYLYLAQWIGNDSSGTNKPNKTTFRLNLSQINYTAGTYGSWEKLSSWSDTLRQSFLPTASTTFGEGGDFFIINYTNTYGFLLKLGARGDSGVCGMQNTTNGSWSYTGCPNMTYPFERANYFQIPITNGIQLYHVGGSGILDYQGGIGSYTQKILYYVNWSYITNNFTTDYWVNTTHDMFNGTSTACWALDTKRNLFHVIGGFTGWSPYTQIKKNQIYNISSGSWHYGQDFPVEIEGHMCVYDKHRDSIYVFGGSQEINTGSHTNNISKLITRLDLFTLYNSTTVITVVNNGTNTTSTQGIGYVTYNNPIPYNTTQRIYLSCFDNISSGNSSYRTFSVYAPQPIYRPTICKYELGLTNVVSYLPIIVTVFFAALIIIYMFTLREGKQIAFDPKSILVFVSVLGAVCIAIGIIISVVTKSVFCPFI